MTWDGSRASERERLAALIGSMKWVRADGQEVWAGTSMADAILAAGFGDVAEAWDEGHDEGFDYARGEGNGKECNPYRAPSANGGGE